MKGLVFGQRTDYSWYGPCGHTRADARRLAAVHCHPRGVRAVPQQSGAVLYTDGSDDPAGLAIWIPGHLRPGAHCLDVEAWLDPVPD